jgi:hypothetical protein
VSALRGYAFLGIGIAVASDVPSALVWLDEFLRPAFDPWRGDAPDFAVRIVTDPAAHARVASGRPPGAVDEVACFALDQEIVRHPAWIAGDRTVIDDRRMGAFYVLAGTRVDVVVHPGSERFRAGVMRVVRELATARALARGDRLQLHAAGLAVGGRGLLLAGPKGAGKTTLLGHLAAASGADLLTNDRAFLRRGEDGGFAAHGIPTIVNVPPGTLALLPRLADGVPAIERPAHLTCAEADAVLARTGGAGGATTMKLSPAQLARQLGVALRASAELAAIAFLEPHADPDGFAVRRLAERDAERHLRGARYGVTSGKTEATAFERFVGAARPAEADDAVVKALAARVPCLALGVGARRLGDPRAAAAILRARPRLSARRAARRA